ncbi:MAG: DUF305 domain-containing protein [Gemmatimonadales bacterium]
MIRQLDPSNLAALAVLALAACGGASRAEPSPAPVPDPDAGLAAAVAEARADSLRYAYTEADIHFMTGMISHHAQALVMAGWAPSHGASPAVLRLTERIINAQSDEIRLMQNWLRARHQPVPEADPAGMKMQMNGGEHTMLMPGMLSPAQMAALDAARGPEFDRLFLQFMIQHHRGAITMVDQLFNSYGAAQDQLVFKFASDVNIDQTTEIERMQRMLVDLLVAP